MKIEVVAIGDELLSGLTVNSNAAFISREIRFLGWQVSQHITLPDHPEALKKGLQEALERSSCVIATGGLGSACDDRTRAIAANMFNSPMHFDAKVAEDLKRRYGENLSVLKEMATVPAKAEVLLNTVGCAPGFIFQAQGKVLILLPGVPIEMQAMFLEKALPFLKLHFASEQNVKTDLIHFCLMNENEIDLVVRSIKEKYPGIECGIYPGYGSLTLLLLSKNESELKLAKQEIAAKFPRKIFSSPNGKIEEALHEWFLKNKKTLACAESCTGGMIAEKVTANAGASEYFLGSLVTYSNAFKRKILLVSETTLKNKGAVSEETVREMLEGLFKVTETDFGIAASGIAGPGGGTAQKPVGTIFAAIGERGKAPDVGMLQMKGTRHTIMLMTTFQLIGALWRKVVHQVPAFPL